MPTIIDTRKAFRRLQDQGGFSKEQADAIVDLFADVDEQVATKGDIEDLRSDLEQTKKQIMTEMDARLAKLERRLLIVGIPALAALLAIFEFAI